MDAVATDARRQFAVEIVERLVAAGYTAYWAGGCVRDYLLHKVPKDYDVATSAKPNEVREVFGRRRTLEIGAAFGVITVLGPHGAGQVEVATFREDLGYSDGRRPDAVAYTTAEGDARRRDFTINGMFYDPRTDQVIDFVGGQHDLSAQLVRAIGDPLERFREDKLRMLRAVRFACRLSFALEEETADALRQMAPEIRVVSAERIAAEMRAILTVVDKRRALDELERTQLLHELLPELSEVPPADWETTLALLDHLADSNFPTALAALLHSLPSRAAAATTVADRWKLSNHERAKVTWLLTHFDALADAQSQPWSRLQPTLTAEFASDLLRLHEARSALRLVAPEDVAHCASLLSQPLEQLNPRALISGDDLLAARIPRGPIYAELLQAVRSAQLDGRVTNHAEAMQLVQQLLASRA